MIQKPVQSLDEFYDKWVENMQNDNRKVVKFTIKPINNEGKNSTKNVANRKYTKEAMEQAIEEFNRQTQMGKVYGEITHPEKPPFEDKK